MTNPRTRASWAARSKAAAAALCAALLAAGCASADRPVAQADTPRLQVDPYWPKPLPKGWIFGQVAGIATDAADNVWVLQRPRSLSDDERGATATPPLSACCAPAPAVLEFSPAGDLLRAWGKAGPGYDWPQNEHGIYVDRKGFVWITGNGEKDGQILKFTQDGTFVMQIGRTGPQTGNSDTTRMGRPAGVDVDVDRQEVYVADGYSNRRVVVFDSETGRFKRMWGAFGKPPVDAGDTNFTRVGPPGPTELGEFNNPHCVRLARDGMVYVCDRLNNRIQVFRKDGGYVRQFVIAPNTAGPGSVWDMALSADPQQAFMFVADGRNNVVLTLSRNTGEVLATTGRPGRYAGEFHWIHDMAIDSRGNVFTGEVDNGKRVQKFSGLAKN